MDQTVNRLTLDVSKNNVNINEPVKLRKGDSNSHTIEVSVKNHGKDYPLNGLTAELMVTKPNGDLYTKVGSVNGSKVSITPDKQLTTDTGKTTGYLEIRNANGTVIDSTNNFDIAILNSVKIADVSRPYIDSVQQLIDHLSQSVDTSESTARNQMEQLRKDFDKFKADYQAVLNNNKNLDMSCFELKKDSDLLRTRVTNLENGQSGFVRYQQFTDDVQAQAWSAQSHGFAVTPN